MRLFIAIDLPAPVRAALAEVQARLRRHDLAVRWAAIEGMHLTLQFLGETEAQLLPDLRAALARIPPPSFTLRLSGLGTFPNPTRPRVLWVGLGNDLAPLDELQQAVLDATRPLGFAPEARAFSPHLTLGRTRQEASSAQIQAIASAVHNTAPPVATIWLADQARLFQSTSTPNGMVYTILGPS
ncbi:MAG: RNA 2',3'-cyclic phosphodiesterase [Oscillochloris sp.]|nr:RNA 2',3'-cyclic phosphodiesterase [Oscillochloris sp.]